MGLFSSLFACPNPPQLTIELVPCTCWYKNVREEVSSDQWRDIRRIVCDGAGNKCQVCGWQASARHPLHCHEVWSYHERTSVQRLEGFIALCDFCHEVKHIGLARTKGRGRAAIAHLARVNGWSWRRATDYVNRCFDEYDARSQREWRQDLTILDEWL